MQCLNVMALTLLSCSALVVFPVNCKSGVTGATLHIIKEERHVLFRITVFSDALNGIIKMKIHKTKKKKNLNLACGFKMALITWERLVLPIRCDELHGYNLDMQIRSGTLAW